LYLDEMAVRGSKENVIYLIAVVQSWLLLEGHAGCSKALCPLVDRRCGWYREGQRDTISPHSGALKRLWVYENTSDEAGFGDRENDRFKDTVLVVLLESNREIQMSIPE